jgi:N-acetylglutamate synthase-like GNAT family acetyltransferase
MYKIEQSNALSQKRLEFVENVIDTVWSSSLPMFRHDQASTNAALELIQPFYVVAMSQDYERAVGFAMSSTLNMTDQLRTITWLVVDPEERHKGIGSRLVTACINDAADREKGILLGTTSPEFFEKMNFKAIGKYLDGQRKIMQFDHS